MRMQLKACVSNLTSDLVCCKSFETCLLLPTSNSAHVGVGGDFMQMNTRGYRHRQILIDIREKRPTGVA